ncbi:hypothetical protein ACWD62_38995 [Streptomyces sp. NPDC005146]
MLTTDALHIQHGHGTYLNGRGAHYLAIVKKSHPGLYAQVRKLPWRDIPLGHRTRERAHHRDEIRRLKASAFAHAGSPVRNVSYGTNRPTASGQKHRKLTNERPLASLSRGHGTFRSAIRTTTPGGNPCAPPPSRRF